MRRFRINMQMIFQDPFSSLNPRLTVKELISEPLISHKIGNEKLAEEFLKRYKKFKDG